jgi:hypothetical protein
MVESRAMAKEILMAFSLERIFELIFKASLLAITRYVSTKRSEICPMKVRVESVMFMIGSILLRKFAITFLA